MHAVVSVFMQFMCEVGLHKPVTWSLQKYKPEILKFWVGCAAFFKCIFCI